MRGPLPRIECDSRGGYKLAQPRSHAECGVLGRGGESWRRGAFFCKLLHQVSHQFSEVDVDVDTGVFKTPSVQRNWTIRCALGLCSTIEGVYMLLSRYHFIKDFIREMGDGEDSEAADARRRER